MMEVMVFMETMVFMEAMPIIEVTGFGRRRGGGEAAGYDKRTEGEGGNSGLDRHLQSPSDLSAAVVARMPNCTELFDLRF
jgi:hypothetical protein